MTKETEAFDIIGRPINDGDFVVYYSNVYRVQVAYKHNSRIKLAEPSKTTKSVVKSNRDMCLIPAEDVTLWLLKKGYR